jgi:hypothetical protein
VTLGLHYVTLRQADARIASQAAILATLNTNLDREEDRIVQFVQEKTALIESLELQSSAASGSIEEGQEALDRLDWEARVVTENLKALSLAVTRLSRCRLLICLPAYVWMARGGGVLPALRGERPLPPRGRGEGCPLFFCVVCVCMCARQLFCDKNSLGCL